MFFIDFSLTVVAAICVNFMSYFLLCRIYTWQARLPLPTYWAGFGLSFYIANNIIRLWQEYRVFGAIRKLHVFLEKSRSIDKSAWDPNLLQAYQQVNDVYQQSLVRFEGIIQKRP